MSGKKIVIFLLSLCLSACVKHVTLRESDTQIWPADYGPSGGGFFRGLACGDINADGLPDLVGGGFNPGGIKIWLAHTDGFKAIPNPFPDMGEVRALAMADLNHDGKLDIVSCVRETLNGIQIWYQKDINNWEMFTVTKTGTYEDVVIGDINNDGYMDIIAANAYSDKRGGIQVWLGDENGIGTQEQGPTRAGIFYKVLAADFNKDGNQDILAASWGRPGGIKLWLGNGNGSWSTASSVADKGYYRGILAADFNNDTFLDIIAAPFQKGLELWWGNSKWKKTAKIMDEGSFWDLKTIDINHDDYPDILASSFHRKGMVLLLPKAEEWLQYKSLPHSGSFYDIASSDFNSDGAEDIVASSYGEGVKVWLNKFTKESSNVAAIPPVPTKKIKIKDIEIPSPPIEEELYRPVPANKTFKMVDGEPEYLIGPKDILEITFWDKFTPQKFEVEVDGRGMVSIPYMDIKVEELTIREISDQILSKLSKIVRKPRVNIMIREYRSKHATLIRAIVSPTAKTGVFVLKGRTVLMDLIGQAGGYTEKADLRNIKIHRANGQTIKADLYKAISLGNQLENIILDDGDTVFIPAKKEAPVKKEQVYVLGEVQKPGVYTIEESLNVLQLISMAGGYTDSAMLESTNIIRGNLANPEIIPVDLEKLLEKGDITENQVLVANDIIFVPKTFISDVNDFFSKLIPALQTFMYPGIYRDLYTTGGGLRGDTGYIDFRR